MEKGGKERKFGNKEQQRMNKKKRNVEEEFVIINIFDLIYFLKLWQPREEQELNVWEQA